MEENLVLLNQNLFKDFILVILKMVISPFYSPSSNTTTYQILLNFVEIGQHWKIDAFSAAMHFENFQFTFLFAILNYPYIPNFVEIGQH